MFKDNAIWMGVGAEPDNKPVSLLLDQANRHGLIAGASGTGKTVTLKGQDRDAQGHGRGLLQGGRPRLHGRRQG